MPLCHLLQTNINQYNGKILKKPEMVFFNTCSGKMSCTMPDEKPIYGIWTSLLKYIHISSLGFPFKGLAQQDPSSREHCSKRAIG